MLRVALSIIVLAGWAAAAPLARSAAADQTATVTIKGSVSYETEKALPTDSWVVIELHHVPALPNAAAVAEKRIKLELQTSPVSFEFAVERYKLVRGVTYVVRPSIVHEKHPIFTADDVKIDVTPDTADAKEIALKPVK